MCNCKDYSRRDFLKSSLMGSSGLIALNNFREESKSPYLNFVAKKSTRDHTVIQVIYLKKPVPTWPYPDIDIDAEMKKINSHLDNFEKLWRDKDRDWDFNLKFVGRDLLTRDQDDIAQYKKTVGDVDGIILFQLTSTCMVMIDEIIKWDIPVVLYNYPPSGHDWSQIPNIAKSGKRVDVISSSNYADLEPYVRTMDTIRRLKQSKIIVVGPHSGSDRKIFADKYGAEIIPVEYSDLNKVMDTIDEKKAEKEAEKFIRNAVKIIEPSRDDIVLSSKFYLAVKKMLAENEANAMTINCLGGFYGGHITAYPCLTWTRLLDEGLTGVCEADIKSTITSMIFRFYTGGKPGFVTDPFFDTNLNIITQAHCVSATKMNGPSGKSNPYIIRTHMEDNKGVSIQVKMDIGQVVTSAQLVDPNTMQISTQKITRNSDGIGGCRTKFECKVIDPETGEELSAEKYLHNYVPPLHRVVFYGNYYKDLQKMGKLLGFEVVRES